MEARELTASDGYRLAYRRWNPTGAPRAIIVALNGIMSHSGWFAPLAPGLTAAGCRLVGADRRGSGPNPDARGDAPSAAQLVQDVLAVIEAEREEGVPLLLLGWCWGAALAVGTAVELDDALAGLVLVTPGLYNQPAMLEAVRAQQELLDSGPPGDPVIVSPVREEWFTRGPALDAFIRTDALRVTMMSPRLLHITARLGAAALLRLRKLKSPLLVILAEHDEATDNAATRVAFSPYARRLETVPGSHGVQFDAPGAVVAHIVGFVDELG